ncbi:apolipoprotein N-acyltransferase [Ectothiorhodospiraceae bacterium WFHF3C12]|nr:apolipoprotein N-acyltransferase [Ectothiorhodospiraceae bacterium WFHF3C12]
MQAWLSSRWAPLIALVAGLLAPLAFAPFDLWPLAVVSPAILFAVAQVSSRRRALLAGYLYGLGYFGFGCYWVYNSIAYYGGGPLAAIFVTPLFALAIALYPMLVVYLARRLRPASRGAALWLVFPAVWLLVEWLRSWFLTGATWLMLGFTQTGSPLGSIAPVFGAFGISLVVVVLAGALAHALLRPRAAAGFLVATVVALGGGYLVPGGWTQPAGEAKTTALLQGNVPQDKKWLLSYRDRTLGWYSERSREHAGVDLIVWPETAVPTWYFRVREDWMQPLSRELAEQGTALVVGAPVIDIDREAAYNGIVVVGPPERVYHKRHLVPFGEYLPLRGLLGNALDFLGTPMDDFDAGVSGAAIPVNGYDIGASICYEVTFGDEIAAALPEAEVLVNVSNDGWFGDSFAPHQHLQMAQMRAMETGRYMLRATNTGVTVIIDHRGRITGRTAQFEEAVLAGEFVPRTGVTPYVRWLHWPAVGVAVVLLLVGFAFRWGR